MQSIIQIGNVPIAEQKDKGKIVDRRKQSEIICEMDQQERLAESFLIKWCFLALYDHYSCRLGNGSPEQPIQVPTI